MVTFDHEELITFSDAGFATDLEIRGDEAIVVLENRVVKVDLLSGQILADTELMGPKKLLCWKTAPLIVAAAALTMHGSLRTHQSSRVVGWRRFGLGRGVVPTEGPTLPSQEIDGCRWQSVHRCEQRVGFGRSRAMGFGMWKDH